jgi:predicted Zn finger-like uncharacterized protein
VQAQCPQCATRIQIDDAKVPDKPFRVRCPKCQALLTLPGRTAEPAPATAPEPPPGSAAPPPDAELPSPGAIARQERLEASQSDAIVALAGPAAAPLQQVLARIGYQLDTVEDIEEGARLLEQGVYEMAVTSPGVAEAGRPETLAQRILRLSPESRRRVFVVLVGEQFRSGDGNQAWAVQADLVLHPSDAGRCETLIRATLAERRRLYQPFLDARRRIESE